MMNRMILEVASLAVTVSELTKGAESWAEWVEEEEQVSRRSRKEEEWLWKRLEESDREQAKTEKINNWKKAAKVEKARKRMGAKSSQPSIKNGWTKRAGQNKSLESSAVDESRPNQAVKTLSVAQLNTQQVTTSSLAPSVAQLQHKGPAQLNTQPGTTPNLASVEHQLQHGGPEQRSDEQAKPEQFRTPAHPISQPQECSEAIARIGLVAGLTK